MAKVSKKTRRKSRINNYHNTLMRASQQPGMNKTQIITQTYDASQHIRRDLKWSAITGGVVVLLMVIVYTFFH